MKNSILVICFSIFTLLACNVNEPITPANEAPAGSVANTETLPSELKVEGGLVMSLSNVQKVTTWEKKTPMSTWQPTIPFRVPVTYTFELKNVKTIDVSAGVALSLCSSANLIALTTSICAEAKYDVLVLNSSSVTISKSILLKPYEQRRYTLITKYNRYKGTFKYVNGLKITTDPNVIIDIPVGGTIGDFDSNISK